MANTTAQEVYDSFESVIMDKSVIVDSLELQWLKKAVAEYSTELSPLEYDTDLEEFTSELSQYQIDTLGYMMKKFYQQRLVSKNNKIVSIVGKDISINGMGNLQKYSEQELSEVDAIIKQRINNEKNTAYT